MNVLEIDGDFLNHPKFIALSDAGLMMWLEAAAWCSRYPQSKGLIPSKLLREIAPRALRLLLSKGSFASEADPEAELEAEQFALEALAAELVEADGGGLHERGLLEVRETGWVFHDWRAAPDGHHQRQKPKQKAKQEAGRIGGRRSAEARIACFGSAAPILPPRALSLSSSDLISSSLSALSEGPDPLPARGARKAKGLTKPRAPKWRRAPDEWQPSAQHRELAAALGVDFELELAKFKDHEFAQSKTDAAATFRNWLRGARSTLPRSASGGASRHSTVEDVMRAAGVEP